MCVLVLMGSYVLCGRLTMPLCVQCRLLSLQFCYDGVDPTTGGDVGVDEGVPQRWAWSGCTVVCGYAICLVIASYSGSSMPGISWGQLPAPVSARACEPFTQDGAEGWSTWGVRSPLDLNLGSVVTLRPIDPNRRPVTSKKSGVIVLCLTPAHGEDGR